MSSVLYRELQSVKRSLILSVSLENCQGRNATTRGFISKQDSLPGYTPYSKYLCELTSSIMSKDGKINLENDENDENIQSSRQ